MKTFYLFLISLVFIFSNNFAQSMKGKVILGGEFRFTRSSSDYDNSSIENYKDTRLNIGPRLGYFATDNIQLGIGLKYDQAEISREYKDPFNDSNYETSLFLFDPSIRYYHSLVDNFGFFSELGISIGFGSKKEDGFNFYSDSKIKYEYDLNYYFFHLDPGIYYNFSDHFGIEIRIGGIFYSRMVTTLTKPSGLNDPKIVDSNYGLQFTFKSLSIGIQYCF